MASITWANVVDHAAQLSTVDTDAQTDILAYVNTTLDVSLFGGESGSKLKLARIYLAAHMATVGGFGAAGSSTPVIEETVDRVSRRYADPFSSGVDDTGSLQTTAYGKMYIQLLRTSPARGPFVI